MTTYSDLPRDILLSIMLRLINSFHIEWSAEYTRKTSGETYIFRLSHKERMRKDHEKYLARTVARDVTKSDVECIEDLRRDLINGELKRSTTTLWVDCNALLSYDSIYLGRAKKTLEMAFGLGLVDAVCYSIWTTTRYHEYQYMEMVPLELFVEHFGKDAHTNPHGIKVDFDQSTIDRREEHVMPWLYFYDYDDEDAITEYGYLHDQDQVLDSAMSEFNPNHGRECPGHEYSDDQEGWNSP